MATQFATVIHLSTGHVLAAVAPVGVEPSLDTLTAGHLRVRVPGTDLHIKVPSTNLKATRVAMTMGNLLDQSLYFAVKLSQTDPPTLTFLGEPTGTRPTGVDGKDVVMAWQDGDKVPVTEGKVGPSDAYPKAAPAGATVELVAVADKPLCLKQLP
jgi:hypothetical protein